MKFEVSRKVLLTAIESVIHAIQSKASLPILQNVLIDLNESRLMMTGTDLQIELRSVTECIPNNIVVIESGKLTVSAKKLMDIVRAFPDETIKIERDCEKLVVKCKRSRFTLPILPADDFPVYQLQGDPVVVEMDRKQLNEALKSVIHAVAQKDVRYYLNGVALFLNPAFGMDVVATDGHRLAKENIQQSVTDECELIITSDSAQSVIRLSNDESDTFTVLLNRNPNNALVVDTGKIRLVAKLIDGKFPAYDRVIPKQCANEVIVNRLEFINALKRCKIVMSNACGIKLTFNESSLKLEGHNDGEESEDEVVLQNYTGTPIEMGFNGVYLQEALSSLDTELVLMKFTDATSAMLIEPTEGSGQRVIMGMRL